MKYTLLTAHAKNPVSFPIGHIVSRGDMIGLLGNTGLSVGGNAGKHVHKTVVKGWIDHLWSLSDMENGIVETSPATLRELNYFTDSEFWGGFPYVVTTSYGSEAYMRNPAVGNSLLHLARDVVVYNKEDPNLERDYPFYWNRTWDGKLLAKGTHDIYGNWACWGYEK